MADQAHDMTQLTRLLAFNSDSERQSFAKGEGQEYNEYTLYLVNNGVPVSTSKTEEVEGENEDKQKTFSADGVSDEVVGYTDLYYGDRKVTDLFIVKDVPDNTYPNDKMYLKPLYSDDVPLLSGQKRATPVGYEIYFKHADVVTPIATSLISKISVSSQGEVILTWNPGVKNSDQYPTSVIVTEDNVNTYVSRYVSQNIVGTPEDTEDRLTIYGTRKYADQVRSDFEGADSLLSTRIDNLSSDLSDESDTRSSEDSKLSSLIEQEADAREKADSDLEKSLESVIEKRLTWGSVTSTST